MTKVLFYFIWFLAFYFIIFVFFASRNEKCFI